MVVHNMAVEDVKKHGTGRSSSTSNGQRRVGVGMDVAASWQSSLGASVQRRSVEQGRSTGGGGAEAERSNDEGEALHYGDSVTLFAEKMFGFLQGASSDSNDGDDDDQTVFVRSLEHRHRATGVLDGELFQIFTPHDYEAQEELQNFLIQHSLMHPSDIPRLKAEQQIQLAQVQRAAEEEIKHNEERQLFLTGRPLLIGQRFQLLHIQSRLFVTIEAPDLPTPLPHHSPALAHCTSNVNAAAAAPQALRVRLTEVFILLYT